MSSATARTVRVHGATTRHPTRGPGVVGWAGTVPAMGELVLPADTYCAAAPGHPFHGPYHDHEYGFPIDDDNALFERLVLEINQAGLSWLTILKKRDAFREAFGGFDIDRVARFTEARKAKLMANAGIIRNRLKIEAAVENAKRLRKIGSFAEWLDAHHPRS